MCECGSCRSPAVELHCWWYASVLNSAACTQLTASGPLPWRATAAARVQFEERRKETSAADLKVKQAANLLEFNCTLTK